MIQKFRKIRRLIFAKLSLYFWKKNAKVYKIKNKNNTLYLYLGNLFDKWYWYYLEREVEK